MEAWLEAERARLGLWLPVALGCGIAAWFALPNQAAWAAWMLGCCALAIAALGFAEGSRVRRAVACFALLAALGLVIVWGRALLVGAPPLARPALAELTGRIERVEMLPARSMARLWLRPEADANGKQVAELVRINAPLADLPPGLARGARIQTRAWLMPPAPPPVPGGYDFARNAWFAGLGATGRALPPIRILQPAPQGAEPWRDRLSAHIRTRLEGGAGAIAATLATGDRGAIAEEDAEAMRRSGLAHLLSISGLHVSAVIGAVILLTWRLLALSRYLALAWPLMLIAAGAGAAAGLGYTLFTGAEVPTVRSCIAALLVLAALALGREAMSLRLIASGALVVLLLWPEAVVSPSFQMSFAAVTVLVALAESRWFRALTQRREEARAMRLARALLALLLTGLAIEAALMPIALYHFHQAGVLGALANMIAIPLITFVIMPGEVLALLLDIAGLGAPLWWLTGVALDAMLALAHGVARQPYAVIALPAYHGAAFALILLGGLWALIWSTRVRYAGLLALAAGCATMALTPRPDILVTGDGRHVIVRTDPPGEGSPARYALLRPRAGDYARDMLAGAAGQGEGGGGEFAALPELDTANCSRDACFVRLREGSLALLLRSRERLAWADLVRACARADIVVADRRLPRACAPRWLKLDRAGLRETGGVAISLTPRRVVRVRPAGDAHPWAQASR